MEYETKVTMETEVYKNCSGIKKQTVAKRNFRPYQKQ